MTNRPLLKRFVVAVALAGVIAGARSGMHASADAGFPTLPDLKHGEGDDITIAIAETGFPNVTYTATGLPPGITMITTVDVNGRITGELVGTLPQGEGGTDPVTNAGSYTGSEGIYTVTVHSSDGSTSNAFTWDVGRWGSGDVFVGAGTWTYQVYDKDGVFKYDVKIPDIDRLDAFGQPTTWGGTTGCAANWHTGEVWATNLDDTSPALNVITRHSGNNSRPYTDSARRLATDWYLPISPYSVDISPESVTFDNDQNMYVGHTAGFANANGDAADIDGNAVWLLDPPGASGYVVVDATGMPIFTGTGQALSIDTWVSPDGYYQDWSSGSPVYLLDGSGARIPVRDGAGADLQKFPLVAGGYTNAVRSFFHMRHGQTGTDNTDLLSDQRTLIYTSESQYAYRYDVAGNGTQLPVLGSNDINSPFPISGRLKYGIRALPPGDGTGGYLIANDVHVDRVDENGRVVQMYDVKDDPAYPNNDANEWFSLAIAPDGRTFWLANRQDVYKIDIASGDRIGSKIHATDGQTHTAAELAGLCVMNEYRAAQENCGVTGLGNGIDDDGDGTIDEGCFRVEICSVSSPGDDDGDGLADFNDPDCGAPAEHLCAAAGPTDASVAGFCARANAEADNVVVQSVPGGTSYAATGLPPGLSINPTTGEITGVPLYSIVNPNSPASQPVVFTVTVTWSAPGTAVFTNTFDWTIYNTNRPPVAVDDSATVLAGSSVLINVKANDSDPDADTFTLLSFTQPANGTVTQVGQQLQYTAPAGFSGVATFTYLVEDSYTPSGVSNVATVTVIVNGPPVARNDAYETASGTTLNVTAPNGIIQNAAGSDSDPEGQTVTVVAGSVTAPGHGSVSVNPDGSFSYTPAPGFVGTDTFTYRVTDGALSSNIATVTIVVKAPPVAVDDAYSTFMNTPITIDGASGMLQNDSDPSGGAIALVLASVTAPSHGVVVPNASANGGFVYTPTTGYVGTDTFTYRNTNGTYQSNTATVTITIRSANNPPVATDDYYVVDQGVLLSVPAGSILSNDRDPDGDTLITERLSSPTPDPGTLFSYTAPGGAFQFRSSPTFVGETTFTYRVTDPYGASSAPATVHIRVNARPVAVNDSYTTLKNTTLTASVAGNDTPSADGGNVWTLVTGAAHGTVTVNANGTFSYVPATNYTGTDSFTYKLCDVDNDCSTAVATIKINDLPVAVNDSYTTPKNTALSGSVAGNDTPSADGGNVWTTVTPPTSGTLVLNTNGTFTYTPATGFTGTVTFTYKVCDVDNDCATAVATIKVNGVPVAVNDSYVTPKNTTLTASVAGNDTPSADGGNVWTLVTGAAHGTVTVNANGTFSYVPATNYTGTDSFTYKLCDVDNDCSTAVATIKINDVPVAVNDSYTTPKNTALTGSVAGNDTASADGGNVWTTVTPPTSGTLALNTNGTFTYTPATGFAGTVTFTYKVCDVDNDCSTAVATIRINDVPVAVNDSYTTPKNTALTGSVAGNDTASADGGNVWTTVTAPTSGTLVLNTNGTFTYTPATGFTGTVTFTYQVCDVDNDCATAVATIKVNDVPVAVNDTYTTPKNTALSGTVAGNDTPSADGGNVWTTVTPPTSGTLALNTNGTFTYTPATGFTGTVTFTYKVCDVDNDCATAVATIKINDVPVAVNDSFVTPKNTTLTGSVAGNDTASADGGNVWTTVTPPTSGTLVLNANGTFTYTPAPGFAGTVTFTYKVCDVDNDCSTAVATIKVNDVPVAVNDTFATDEDTPLFASVTGNDMPSIDGGNVWTKLTNPANGAVIVYADGTFTYTPNANFNGTDSFTYKVCDVDNDCSTATVSITIRPVNDVPLATDDSFTTTEDTPVSGTVVTNDVLSGDGGNVWTLVTSTSNGTLTFTNGTFTYTPKSNFNGIDSFTYKICDVNGDCSTATVIITVNPVNDVPVAVNDSYTMAPNSSITKDAAGNDTPSGDGGNVWTQTSSPASGTVVFNANGTFTYTAATNFSGVVSFNYKLCDANNDCSTATVTITIATVTTGQVGTGDTATIGFWQNNNGQALIKKVNGSASATNLANWLAGSYPYLWGANASAANNLTGKTNTQVAAYYITVFKSDKWMAQVLAGAIASYVTNSTLAGANYAVPYGFNYSVTGTGTKTYNVGSYGTAIGLANNTSYTISALLQQANLRKQQGSYNSGAFNVIFSAINQAGDITK